jgi:putative oxidoreductase
MNKFFSPSPILLNQGIAVVRVFVGALMVYHGQEVFNAQLMNEYSAWDVFDRSNAKWMVYAGKSSELIAGILLMAGIFTRAGAIITIGTLSYITFFIGSGRFWYQDQHPFMFVLFGLLFLFTGPGAWSLDGLIFKNRNT